MSDFESWYSNYPRKEAKKDAEKAYGQQLKSGATHEQIVGGLARFNRHLADHPRERRFIPLPASWLRAGRYLDELQSNQEEGCGIPMHAQLRWRERYNKDPRLVPAGIQKIIGLGAYGNG